MFNTCTSQENQNVTFSRSISANGDISYSDGILKATYSKSAKDFSLSKLLSKLPEQYKDWHQLDPQTMFMYFRTHYLSLENLLDEPEEGFYHREPQEIEPEVEF